MKRYRISTFFIDSIRNVLRQPNPTNSVQMEKIKKDMKNSLISKYGRHDLDNKFKRYMDLEKPPFSVVEEHTYLLEDICDAYIKGSFYSALTGACCLGERIFNNIIFKVGNDFKSLRWYKTVFQKNRREGTIIDWDKGIRILSDWKIIDTNVELKFRQLYKLRTDSVHYQRKQQDLKAMSLEAINIINFIINELFGLNQTRKDILLWFDVPGELYIRKEAEENPLVKAFYLPCSCFVGPQHSVSVDSKTGKFIFSDNHKYENRMISDDEFIRLRKEHNVKK